MPAKRPVTAWSTPTRRPRAYNADRKNCEGSSPRLALSEVFLVLVWLSVLV